MPKQTDESSQPVNETAQAAPELGRVQMHSTDWRVSLLIAAIVVGIFVPVMGSYGMYDPWETHYTEVARQFMERDDWLDTHWHNGTGPEGYSERRFWSKPVGSFWLSGLSLKVLGFQDKITLRGARASGSNHDPGEYITTGSVEWAVRLPFFLCAFFGIFAIYLMVTRLFGRRAGFFTGVVLATAPMYFMIGRQAMTDMPYVGLMSGGLAFFVLGIFGHREELTRRKQLKIGRWTLDWPHSKAYYGFLAAFTLVMALQLRAVIDGLSRVPLPFKVGGATVSAGVVMIIYIAFSLLFIWMSRKTRTRNEVYLYIFYMAVAMAGWSKGLIAALQPGLLILVYILASREWRLLLDAALGRGILLALTVFAPWFHGMLLRYGRSWWNELFGTEQLRRLTVGEQKQAKGTWDYYIQQLGYGLFPWVAFLPAALIRVAKIGPRKERSPEDRARLFIAFWFTGVMLLFTLTVTKYHHYILPAIPPAAILIGIYLDDLLKKKAGAVGPALLVAVVTLTVVGIDMVKQPAHWVWMYTYLYNGNWARGVPEGTPILIYTLIFGALMLAIIGPKLRKYAIWGLVATSILVGGYVLNWHQVKCAPHWSQKYVLKTYYKLRKGPEEELIAWQFNWRGETWHTAAQVVVSKSLDNKKIKKWLKERVGKKFYFVTERSRFSSLRHMMPTAKSKKTLKIVDDSNVHYVLAEAQI
ncbi:MAG: glycosyltransferase family 39 protein [Deltaproteobacteria bacterium]|nr:glycosyltransferase family 39 protein [Deltaproteobacteria bacterium]